MMQTNPRPSTRRARESRRAIGRALRLALSISIGATSCGAPPRAADAVVMASGTDLESGNPVVTIHSLTRQIQRHALFVTLVRFDSSLAPQPYFAQRWTWDTTHATLTMYLCPDLRWHDGVPTTAADVQFTLHAVRDPRVGSPRAGDLTALDSAHVVSDTVVQLFFNAPQSRLANVFAELPLVPKHLLDTVPRDRWRQSTFASAPVGNGPFRFVDRLPQRRWRFARNAEFPAAMGGPPALREIIVAIVDEAATKFAGLVSGDLDVAGVSPTMAHLVARDPTLQLLTPPTLFSNVLAFNTTRAPFDDARVRRAVAWSINRARLVSAAVAGYATPAVGAIPPGLPVSSLPRESFDARLADSLFDAAGWTRRANGPRMRDGKPLDVELITVGSGEMAIEQLVQADLAARGVQVRVHVAEQATFLSTVRAPMKTFDVAITGIPGDIAFGQLVAMFASTQQGGALDYTGFHSAALDARIAAARSARPEQALDAWRAVDAMLLDEAPVVWLYHARGIQGLSRKLEHVTMDLRGELVSVARWTRR